MKLLNIVFVVSCTCILASNQSLVRGGEIRGFVEPFRDIDLATSEMGTLAYINVKEGDRVSQGQVLAGLDESVLQAALDVADKTKAARGRLDSAKEELALHTDRLAKITELHHRQHASAEELARAESQKRVAEAQVRAVLEELEVKAAEHARIDAQLNQKRIKSPIDGIVTQLFKDAGEFISASDPIVVKVVQLDTLLVEFPVPAQAARDFQAGTKAPLRVGADRTDTEGLVEFVSPTTDAQSNTIRVKIKIDNAEGRFHSGDSCWLTVSTSVDSDAAKVPGHFTKTKPKRSSLPR